MTDEEEGPRTVHLDPSELPGGDRFRAPHIPAGKPAQSPVDQPSKPSAATVAAVRPAPEILAAARKLTESPPAPTGDPAPTLAAQILPGSTPRSVPEPSATTEPLGPRPPVMRQARSDRTAVYTSTPRPAGKASVPASSPPGAAPDRPAWTVEPGWSAYPQQPAPTAQPGAPGTSPGHDGLPGGSATEAAETSALAGALLGTGQAPTPPAGTRRTVLIVFLVLIVAAVVGASTAWFAGDAIGDLISKVTG